MEKIQKALEKARQQRVAMPAPSRKQPKQLSPGAPLPPDEPKGITYRQTRVVTAQADVLQEGRVVAGLTTYDELVDTFRILRTQVLQRLNSAGYSTLAVTSANRGEGKSLTAINLAVSLAMHVSRTVLLVDLDLRRPRLHTYFGIEPDVGLNDYLINDAPIANCFINPGVERLVMLPMRSGLQGTSELLSSPKMIGLSEELKLRYPDRIVIYDLPPVLMSDDALSFLQHVDCCLFVVEQGVTSKNDIQRSFELLKGCPILGLVLNKSSNGTKRYSYYED